MDKKTMLELTSNRITAAAMRERGVTQVPITPKGEIPDDVFKRYVTAGEPSGDFFEGHMLVSPEEWERRQRAPQTVTEYDPISGEVLTNTARAAWASLAPYRVLGGEVVSAADLSAYARSKGLLSAEITSTLARMLFPKGSDPITPPEALEGAAQRWPYDGDAAEIARKARRSGGAAKVTQAPTSGGQVIHNDGAIIGQQINVPGDASFTFSAPGRSRQGQLADFFVKCFDVGELSRLLMALPGGIALVNALPGREVPRTVFATAAASALESRGMVDRVFFLALLEARPRFGAEIQSLRALYGV